MPRTEQFFVSLSRGTYERLRAHAEASGLSMAAIVTAIVDSLDAPPPGVCVVSETCEARS